MKVVLFDSAKNIPENKKEFYKSYMDALIDILQNVSINELLEWGYSKDDNSVFDRNLNDDISDNSTFELYKRIEKNINGNDVKVYSTNNELNYRSLTYFFNISNSKPPSFHLSKKAAATSMLLNYAGFYGSDMMWYTNTPDILPSEVTLVNIKMVNWFYSNNDINALTGDFMDLSFASSLISFESYKDQCIKLTNPACGDYVNKLIVYQEEGENKFSLAGENNTFFFKRRGVVVVIRQDKFIDKDGYRIKNKLYQEEFDCISSQSEEQLLSNSIITDRNNFNLTKLIWQYAYICKVPLSGYSETGYYANIYTSDPRELIE